MSNTVQVKVIEVEATKLEAGATYIIAISPTYAYMIGDVSDALHEKGIEALVLPIVPEEIKVFAIQKDDE